jgi:hypothetical protein
MAPTAVSEGLIYSRSALTEVLLSCPEPVVMGVPWQPWERALEDWCR